MITIIRKCVANASSIVEDSCTEPTELVVGMFYVWWAVSVDITASPYYSWMVSNTEAWRIITFALALLRILSTLLGGKWGRFYAGLMLTALSITFALGFALSGWFAASGCHFLFAVLAGWCVFRIYSRLHNRTLIEPALIEEPIHQ